MKVLYVEDNPANVFLVKRVARMGKHEIINYIDGDVALKKYDEIQPDLVLMDIQLAGNKSGLDVVKKLRERGVTTPIIAVTAYAMVGDKERCLKAGCDDYLAKPLPVQRLVEIFQHYSDLAASNPQTDTGAIIDEEKPVSAEAPAVSELAEAKPAGNEDSHPENTETVATLDLDDTEIDVPDAQEVVVSSPEANGVDLAEETAPESDSAPEPETQTTPSASIEDTKK